jgi:uncharacterized protein
MAHEYKTLEFKVTDLDWEGRTVEGYAASFNNTDLVGDIIHKGAFSKTLAERGNKVRFLWQHDRAEPLGRPIEMHEDDRGLFIKAIVSDTSRGRDALALLRDGAISGLSIGYDAMPGGTDYTKTPEGKTIRNLREVRLWEFSLVSMPANEQATVLALKTADDLLTERKEALVASLRAALAEAEALVGTLPAAQDAAPDVTNAPAEDAGREENATEQGAEPGAPTEAQPLTPEQEALRQELLTNIQRLTED